MEKSVTFEDWRLAMKSRLVNIARWFGYRTPEEKRFAREAYRAQVAENNRRDEQFKLPLEAAEEENRQVDAAAERTRVQIEIEAALAAGNGFVPLIRTNEHWQDAVLAYANANQGRGLTVQFPTHRVSGYIDPYKGQWLPPQKALLTFPVSKV